MALWYPWKERGAYVKGGLGLTGQAKEELRARVARFGFRTNAVEQHRTLLLGPVFERIRHGGKCGSDDGEHAAIAGEGVEAERVLDPLPVGATEGGEAAPPPEKERGTEEGHLVHEAGGEEGAAAPPKHARAHR